MRTSLGSFQSTGYLTYDVVGNGRRHQGYNVNHKRNSYLRDQNIKMQDTIPHSLVCMSQINRWSLA